jgi:hypothetical protein
MLNLPIIRANGLQPSSSAARRVINKQTAAPSLIFDAFAAVIVPSF